MILVLMMTLMMRKVMKMMMNRKTEYIFFNRYINIRSCDM